MILRLPTEFPATLALPEGFWLSFTQLEGSVTVEFHDYMGGVGYDDGCDAATAFLSWMGCADEGEKLPATVVLALHNLAHEAVDVVCHRLSSEPLESAIFAEDDRPTLTEAGLAAMGSMPVTDPFEPTTPVYCPVCGCEMVMDYDGGELVCSSEDCDARQPIGATS